MFDRQLARHYFLFAANSGMRSGELRKLKWEDVEVKQLGAGNQQEERLVKRCTLRNQSVVARLPFLR